MEAINPYFLMFSLLEGLNEINGISTQLKVLPCSCYMIIRQHERYLEQQDHVYDPSVMEPINAIMTPLSVNVVLSSGYAAHESRSDAVWRTSGLRAKGDIRKQEKVSCELPFVLHMLCFSGLHRPPEMQLCSSMIAHCIT